MVRFRARHGHGWDWSSVKRVSFAFDGLYHSPMAFYSGVLLLRSQVVRRSIRFWCGRFWSGIVDSQPQPF